MFHCYSPGAVQQRMSRRGSGCPPPTHSLARPSQPAEPGPWRTGAAGTAPRPKGIPILKGAIIFLLPFCFLKHPGFRLKPARGAAPYGIHIGIPWSAQQQAKSEGRLTPERQSILCDGKSFDTSGNPPKPLILYPCHSAIPAVSVMARHKQRRNSLVRKDIPALVVDSCHPERLIANTPNVV